jgi:hypothetical protein
MSVAVSSMSEPPSAVSGPVRGVSVPVELGVSGGLWAVSGGAEQMALLRPQDQPGLSARLVLGLVHASSWGLCTPESSWVKLGRTLPGPHFAWAELCLASPLP